MAEVTKKKPEDDKETAAKVAGTTVEQPSENPEGGASAKGGFMDTATKAAGTASKAASTASKHVSRGLAAMREVRSASKQHSSARTRMQDIQDDLDADQATLDHRNEVDRDFSSIISEQTGERDDAQHDVDAAQAEIDQLTKDHDSLTQQLEKMKDEHEQQLRPYKNLAESTKSRSDDANKTLADVKRAVRTAESQVNEATNRRDSRIAVANKAVDNAQARLQRLQDELSALQKDPSTGAKTITEMRTTVAAELAHLETAKSEVSSVMEETQKSVDNAQTHLWTQKQSLEVAEKAADEAKENAKERKEEYDKMLQDAETEEATLDNEAVAKEMRIRDVTKELKAAQARVDAAQALIDEANDIHSTPDATRELEQRVSDEKAALEVQQQQVDQLAETERSLRERTRQERAIVIAIIVAVAAIVLLVLWLVFGAH